jgi:hypothetical protein
MDNTAKKGIIQNLVAALTDPDYPNAPINVSVEQAMPAFKQTFLNNFLGFSEEAGRLRKQYEEVAGTLTPEEVQALIMVRDGQSVALYLLMDAEQKVKNEGLDADAIIAAVRAAQQFQFPQLIDGEPKTAAMGTDGDFLEQLTQMEYLGETLANRSIYHDGRVTDVNAWLGADHPSTAFTRMVEAALYYTDGDALQSGADRAIAQHQQFDIQNLAWTLLKGDGSSMIVTDPDTKRDRALTVQDLPLRGFGNLLKNYSVQKDPDLGMMIHCPWWKTAGDTDAGKALMSEDSIKKIIRKNNKEKYDDESKLVDEDEPLLLAYKRVVNTISIANGGELIYSEVGEASKKDLDDLMNMERNEYLRGLSFVVDRWVTTLGDTPEVQQQTLASIIRVAAEAEGMAGEVPASKLIEAMGGATALIFDTDANGKESGDLQVPWTPNVGKDRGAVVGRL